MVRSREIQIPATDGFELSARQFLPPGAVRANLLLNPATGVRKEFYLRFSAFLAERGFRVVTFDNRGIGGSRRRFWWPPRVVIGGIGAGVYGRGCYCSGT